MTQPLFSIPAPHIEAHAGLLQSPDWWYPLVYALVYALVFALAILCVPSQFRESLAALWEPFGRFFASLSALSALIASFFIPCCLGLTAPIWCLWLEPVEDNPKPCRGYRTGGDGYVYAAGT